MTTDRSRIRRSIAAALAGVAAYAASGGKLDLYGGPFAVALIAAAAGLLLRSVTTQVLARGALWAVLGFAVLDLASAYARLPVELARSLTCAVTLIAALTLARPTLREPWARAAFAPVRYRWLLLAGATAAAGIGTASILLGLPVVVLHGLVPLPAGVLGYGAALLAVAAAIARMRAWGILVAIVGAFGALAGLLAVDMPVAFSAIPTLPGMAIEIPVTLRSTLPLALAVFPAACLGWVLATAPFTRSPTTDR